jgi:N-methylhydantoinase A
VEKLRVAIDTGGTFTDCVFVQDGQLKVLKVLSTPERPAQAILNAIETIASQRATSIADVLHGTTVATNALLERKGARVALITTAGFEDVILIGRQNRQRLYDLFYQPPPPLVSDARFGVAERVDAQGVVLHALTDEEVARIKHAVQRAAPEAIAVTLLFSFLRPEHEKRLGAALKTMAPVSLSHEILPEFREYERTVATVANAYLQPLLSRYVEDLAAGLKTLGKPESATRLRVMQSNGGMISAATAASQPVRTVLSGPAGGVVGAHQVAHLSGIDNILSFDMGGTSTDVSLISGTPGVTKEAEVAGLPLSLPILDIHTVGSGGGSLARFDAAGALRVGPESAGANPGPIAYGRGGSQPTITDAHLLLGRIHPERFAAGALRMSRDDVQRRITQWLHQQRRRETATELAHGMVEVANAVMEKALRVISVERGVDPRDYWLLAFGGAGGLHACELADRLRLSGVLLPSHPGALSALGILLSKVVRDFSLTRVLPLGSQALTEARRVFQQLDAKAREAMAQEEIGGAHIHLLHTLDLRYAGQGFEIEMPEHRHPESLAAAFHAAHRQRYGYADEKRLVEIVNLRVRAQAETERPRFRRRPVRHHRAQPLSRQAVWWQHREVRAATYERESMRPGATLLGPAVICEYSATSFVPPGWHAAVDAWGSILLTKN